MEALAVKYRPQKFSDVCSQKSIIKILERQIETNTIKNCYLFCGASGCGKTTTARIFANLINKGEGSAIEIDAASNNGVEPIRQLVSESSLRSVDSTYKVYILDECHTFSNQAWQAFLKTIEEPPTYTVFIFCTTDPQKIPETILNRVMRFNFNRIDSATIYNRLCYISEQEHFTNYIDTCDYISRICSGEMRNGIAMLEKCASYSTDLSIDNCMAALGNYSYDTYFALINGMIDGAENKIIDIIEHIYNDGNDLKLFVNQFLNFCLDVTKYVIFKNVRMTAIPITQQGNLDNACNFNNAYNYYVYYIDELLKLKNMLKADTDPKSTIEVYMLKMARLK